VDWGLHGRLPKPEWWLGSWEAARSKAFYSVATALWDGIMGWDYGMGLWDGIMGWDYGKIGKWLRGYPMISSAISVWEKRRPEWVIFRDQSINGSSIQLFIGPSDCRGRREPV
jgi:hypothetical protein